jgi:hypothetical protein
MIWPASVSPGRGPATPRGGCLGSPPPVLRPRAPLRLRPWPRAATCSTNGLRIGVRTKVFHIHDCAATGEALTGRVLGDRLGLDCGSEAQSSISLAS